MSGGNERSKEAKIAGSPDHGGGGEAAGGDVSSTTYGSNVSGSQVGSMAVGDQSRALTIVHQHGLSFTETEKLFGLLFEQNFPKLAEQARNEARRRVDEFATTFTRVAAAQNVTEEQLGGFAEPDVQFVLNTAIEASARQDNAEMWEVLARLIIRRLANHEDDLERLALSEAVYAASRMVPRQLRLLALNFLMIEAKWFAGPATWQACNKFLDEMVAPLMPAQVVAGDLLHIGYAGCASVATGMYVRLSAVIAQRYPDLFRDSSGHALETDPQWSAVIEQESPVLRHLCMMPAPLPFHSMVPTTVGVVLAVTVIEQVTGKRLSIDRWLR